LEILFERGHHYLQNILHKEDECVASTLNVLDQPLIVYNIKKMLAQNDQTSRILLPEGLKRTSFQIHEKFPSIQVDEYADAAPSSASRDSVRISLNSYMAKQANGSYAPKQIVYPWDLLQFTEEVLRDEVTETRVSKDAFVSENAVLAGPCIISSEATVDDFSKIKGPAYIGSKSKVGMGSLVRESMIGPECAIGFNCEIGRSYFAGIDRTAHHDVVLDSILGWNDWIAAFVGTTNVLLNNKTVRYKMGAELVDTGLSKFGAVISHDCTIAASVIILPGRYVPPNSMIQAGTIFSGIAE
jgi:carbonic anhydrase/acetyltransferase-like protein (isoleucine patch superfamily)